MLDVLVLYLERPPRNRAQLERLQGRFGYSTKTSRYRSASSEIMEVD